MRVGGPRLRRARVPDERVELLEEPPGLRVQPVRCHDDDPDELVPAPARLEIRKPLPTEAEHGVGLRPRRDPHPRRAVERRDLDVPAQRRLRERDRPVQHDVPPVPLELRVRPRPDDDIEVPRRRPGIPRVPLPGDPELESVRRPRRDLHVERRGRLDAARPAARRARGLGELSPPLALRARRDADELGEPAALAPAHLPLAVALGAREDPPVLRAGALALLARGGPGDPDFLTRPVDEPLEADVDLDLEVLPATGAPPPAAAPEDVLEQAPAERGAAEERLEEVLPKEVPDVPRMGEPGPVEVLPAPDLLLQPLAAVRVVDLPLPLVREDLVRLGEFLEALLGDLLVTLRHVGMVFLREPAVRLLDVVPARGPGNPEDVVVVPLAHGVLRFSRHALCVPTCRRPRSRRPRPWGRWCPRNSRSRPRRSLPRYRRRAAGPRPGTAGKSPRRPSGPPRSARRSPAAGSAGRSRRAPSEGPRRAPGRTSSSPRKSCLPSPGASSPWRRSARPPGSGSRRD